MPGAQGRGGSREHSPGGPLAGGCSEVHLSAGADPALGLPSSTGDCPQGQRPHLRQLWCLTSVHQVRRARRLMCVPRLEAGGIKTRDAIDASTLLETSSDYSTALPQRLGKCTYLAEGLPNLQASASLQASSQTDALRSLYQEASLPTPERKEQLLTPAHTPCPPCCRPSPASGTGYTDGQQSVGPRPPGFRQACGWALST